MFNALDVSTSALVAQRIRLNAISSNIANLSTTHNEAGQRVPYQPKFVIFQAEEVSPELGQLGAAGVRVASVETAQVEPRLKFQPKHPDADANGYVAYPNIDMTAEFVDALEASRAYEANVGVMEITKNLSNQTLKILV